MKVLIIHHLEAIWENGYKNAGTSFWKLEYKFGQFLNENSFDKVIITNFELPSWFFRNGLGFKGKYEFYNTYPNIGTFITDYHEYGYGWDKENLETDPNNFVIGGNHSEAVLVEDWMRNLKNDEVYISGAFDGECIEDLEIALRGCGVEFKRVNNLII
jgi:hypothetical protein